MGLHSRNIKVPNSCAIRPLDGQDLPPEKTRKRSLKINVQNKHDCVLEVYSMDDPENPNKVAELEPEEK